MTVIEPNSSDKDHLYWLTKSGIPSMQGLRVLDLGCGSGYICHKAMEDGAAAAVGIDLLKPRCLLADSRWLFLESNLDGNTWVNHLNDQRFDLILAFDILEHLESPYIFLQAAKSVMSDHAVLVLTTPNTMSWERFARPSSWSGVKDPQHKVLFSRYSLKFLLSRAGLKCCEIKAPMRSLDWLGSLQPQIGGQIICHAMVNNSETEYMPCV